MKVGNTPNAVCLLHHLYAYTAKRWCICVCFIQAALCTPSLSIKWSEMDILTGVVCTYHTDFKNIALFEAWRGGTPSYSLSGCRSIRKA